MIPDTDEELEIWLRKNGWIISRETIKQLRALINHYIAKDRAQGQEPVAEIDEYGLKIYTHLGGFKLGTKLYTHAQPIAETVLLHDSDCSLHNAGVPELYGACDCSVSKVRGKSVAEIQAEALEKAASELVGKTILLSEGAGVRNAHSHLINKAAKLRKGEPL